MYKIKRWPRKSNALKRKSGTRTEGEPEMKGGMIYQAYDETYRNRNDSSQNFIFIKLRNRRAVERDLSIQLPTCFSIMSISTLPVVRRRYTNTGDVCPMRWQRAIACPSDTNP